jgi:acetolactate synthase-1/2/3 large subunit
MEKSGAELLLEIFESQDIEYIFCSPGSEHYPIWESLARRYSQGDRRLKYINCRHELLAVSMAQTYAQTTGRLPVVLLHAGVGPLNAAMAIRIAYRAGVPMLILSGDTSDFGEAEDDKGDCWKWLGALAELGGTDALVREYVKWSNAVTSRQTLVGHVYRACDIARSYPKGPVFLSIPWEYFLRTQPEVPIRPPSQCSGQPSLRQEVLEKVAEMLLASKQPIILTEHAGRRPETVPRLVELSELLGIPVFEAIYPRFANFPREHPLHMGYNASEGLRVADLIFIVGGITPWQPPSAFPRKGTRAILLDEDTLKDRLPYWGYQLDLAVAADMEPWLTALIGILRGRVGRSAGLYRERAEVWRKKHDELTANWKAEALGRKDKKPISPRWFLYRAAQILPENTYILAELSTHGTLAQRYLARPGGFFKALSGGLGMSAGGTAGVKLALPERPVVLLIGDGSFYYNPTLSFLGVCQEYQLPVLTIVFNNGIYGAMKSIHKKYYPKGYAVGNNLYFGVNITPVPDYRKIGESFGAYSVKLEDPNEIEPALKGALEQMGKGRSALIDLVLDPEDAGGYESVGS